MIDPFQLFHVIFLSSAKSSFGYTERGDFWWQQEEETETARVVVRRQFLSGLRTAASGGQNIDVAKAGITVGFLDPNLHLGCANAWSWLLRPLSNWLLYLHLLSQKASPLFSATRPRPVRGHPKLSKAFSLFFFFSLWIEGKKDRPLF